MGGSSGTTTPTHSGMIFIKMSLRGAQRRGNPFPLCGAVRGGVRIATPACAPVRNDTGFWGCGACRRRGEGARCGRVVGEIGEAPPVAEEASRFRGSAPIGGHDSGRESVGTTVGNRRPLRMFCSFSVGRHPCVPPYRCFSAQKRGCGVPHPVVRTPPRRRPRYTFPRTFAALR